MSISKIRPPLILAVLALCVSLSAVAHGSSYNQLDYAKTLMNKGEYRPALDQFRQLYNKAATPPDVRREAAYYLGFCQVKMNDYWSAIHSYTEFLAIFDTSGNTTLVPDALYVLGRVYELVNAEEEAIRKYRDCIRRFPGSNFAKQSKERLNALGSGANTDYPYEPGYPHDPHNPEYPHYPDNYDDGYLSPQIHDLVELAMTCSASYQKDELLQKAAKKAQSESDFAHIIKKVSSDIVKLEILSICINNKNFKHYSVSKVVKLVKYISNSSYRDDILVKIARHVHRAEEFRMILDTTDSDIDKIDILKICSQSHDFQYMSADDAVTLSLTVHNASYRDDFLLKAARKLARSTRDFQKLAKAASRYTGQEILKMAQDAIMGGDYYRTSDLHATDRTKDSISGIAIGSKTLNTKDITSNPFRNLRPNEDSIKRIANFLDAVKTRTNIEETQSGLLAEDFELDSVAEALIEVKALKAFDNLHEVNR